MPTEIYLDTVKEAVSKVLLLSKEDTDKITTDSTLKDIGADSLDTVEIIMEIEERLDVAIDDYYLFKMKTVNDIITYLKENK